MEERLQNILAHAGVASRRAAATLVESGAVTVDGVVVREPGARFEPEKVSVRVNGRPLAAATAKRTIVLYKPVGVLSTMSDPFGGKTVADIVYGKRGNAAAEDGGSTVSERLVPVGRLDKDSEGLLLMSNDGDLVNRLTHPRFEHRKTYLVRVAGRWTDEKLALLRSPITLDDGYTIRPVPVEVVDDRSDSPYCRRSDSPYCHRSDSPYCRRLGGSAAQPGTKLLRFVLKEGRKRQIRKMCSAAHLVVLTLKRMKVGAFELPPELRPGEWRDLTPDEVKALFA